MKTRGQVQSELKEALRTGDILADGESGLKRNELEPERYPARELPPGKPRAQVRAELAEAIRTGDLFVAGDSGLKLNEIAPQRYATSRAAPAVPAASARSWSPGADETSTQ